MLPPSRRAFGALVGYSLHFWLTCVVCNQLLQGWEGVVGGDVVSTFVHGADFVVFYHISLLGYVIPDRQRVGSWGAEEDSRRHSCGELFSRARGPSPGEVSLSRTRKEPVWFPGANSSRSVSFLLMSLKNHLQECEDAIVTQAGPDWQNPHVSDGSLLPHLQGICSGHIVVGYEALLACRQGLSHPPLAFPVGHVIH